LNKPVGGYSSASTCDNQFDCDIEHIKNRKNEKKSDKDAISAVVTWDIASWTFGKWGE
jgi:hypothetical protein